MKLRLILNRIPFEKFEEMIIEKYGEDKEEISIAELQEIL